jgi:hypothetical protein
MKIFKCLYKQTNVKDIKEAALMVKADTAEQAKQKSCEYMDDTEIEWWIAVEAFKEDENVEYVNRWNF